MKNKLPKIPVSELTWYIHCLTYRGIDECQAKTFGPVPSRESAENLGVAHSSSGKYDRIEVNQNSNPPEF